MKKTLTLMLVGILAAASWAQPTPPTSGDGTLPNYEQKPGWFDNGNATANPGSNPNNAGGGRRRWRQNGQNGQNGQPWNNGNMQNGQNGQGPNGQGGGQGRHGKRWARFDTNNDGQLDAGEKAAAKAQMLQRFDTNGDGKLSQQERQAIRQMRGQNGQGGGRHRHNGQMNNGQPNNGPLNNSNPSSPSSPSPGTTSRGGPFG